MRQIALIGLILCMASLLMSARMADGSVDTLVANSIQVIRAVDGPMGQAPDPSAHFSLE